MKYIARFITIVTVLSTFLIALPPRSASAIILWTPPLRGNLGTGSVAECIVFFTGTTATKATASIVVDLIQGDTGEVIATGSATGPFSPGTEVAAAHVDSTVAGPATACRITANGVQRAKLRAVLEMFSGVTGIPAAAVPLVK